MKTLGEAAMDLPWLAPSVASMTALARAELPSVWHDLRTDPGIVLLSAHLDKITSDALLESVLKHQPHFHAGFVDWNESGPDVIRTACCRYAALANQLAQLVGDNSERPWIAAFLAPLGWLAAATIEPDSIGAAITLLGKNTDNAGWQREAWGLDHAALTRRLSRCWHLPAWLSTILANLGLHAGIAERLGADARLVRIVQLAILAAQTRGFGLGLVVGTDMDELTHDLGITSKDVDEAVATVLHADVPAWTWDEHAEHTLLPELLQLALENRRLKDSASIERLHTEIDLMQDALTRQCAGEKDRLQTAKLSALAEFAAGAGHEINNPLAVISGQAQYVLKQMDWLDVPAEEIEDVTAYMDNIRGKITPSLNKIIGQTQRIHTILTDLMQFARPAPANAQTLSVQSLIQSAADAMQTLAQDRKVRLLCQELGRDEMVRGDVAQVRVALTALLRNAIEAAPVGGWAGIRYQRKDADTLELIVEDDGVGPIAALREHMFDPFYSGRNAGRGRGLGLPTAWRLARQQGGDVRFDGHQSGATRFVLTLPLATIASAEPDCEPSSAGRVRPFLDVSA